MAHKKSKRKGATSGLHYPKEAVSTKTKTKVNISSYRETKSRLLTISQGASIKPPSYADKRGPPGYYTTEDEVLLKVAKKFDLAVRTKEKEPPAESEKASLALDLAIRVKPPQKPTKHENEVWSSESSVSFA